MQLQILISAHQSNFLFSNKTMTAQEGVYSNQCTPTNLLDARAITTEAVTAASSDKCLDTLHTILYQCELLWQT